MAAPLAEPLREARRFIDEGRYDDALTALDGLAPDVAAEPQATHLRALTLERLDRVDEAFACCEMVLEPNPRDFPAMLTLGSLHARRGERVSALERLRRATRLAARRADHAAAQHLLATMGGKGFAAPMRAEVVDLFDRYAERFDHHLVEALGYRGHEAVPSAVRAATGVEAADWLVIDLGCGTGLCGEALRSLAAHLVGVDVAPAIAERARQRGIYDAVFVADLVYALWSTGAGAIDLLVSADVFGYVGDLEAVFLLASRALRRGGRLAFSVEALDGRGDYVMGPSRRFAYRAGYLEQLATDSQLGVDWLETLPLRREATQDVLEHVLVLRKS